MKKILMVMRYYENGKDNNLLQKFESQIQAFRAIGFLCNYFTITENSYVFNSEEGRNVVKKRVFAKLPVVGRIIDYSYVYSLAKKEVVTNDYDYCYIRDCPMVLSFVKMMKHMYRRNIFTIVEVPTHPNDAELKQDKRWWIRYSVRSFKIIEKLAAKYVSLFTIIGTPENKYYNKPAINIFNGTNIERYKCHEYKGNADELHIMALAGMSHYHGFDRLIRGMFEYKRVHQSLPVYLHLVGPDVDGSLRSWRKLSVELGIENHIIVEGEKRGKELDDMFDDCNLGCGSLACHRRNTHVDFDLKTAEYLSRGIPFITCKFSSIFQYKIPYCFSDIDENEKPINIDRILQFVNETKNCQNIVAEMRDFAKEMSWEAQFTRVIEAIEKRKV